MTEAKKNNSQAELEMIRQQIEQLEKELSLLREQFEQYLERLRQREERR